ncbi:MAG: type II toxin-antitoxin system RelE/ParE family toxin [Spirochaetaceae bacterium]|jgi:plasmid stabilization system protein ParE|nr:type II toxin-antitoxin system RelE/ParE family toxin [Spirochaetaceae bacterium]
MYTLFFAKNFKDDVKQSVNYIKHILQAPVAAERLKTEIKKAYKIIKNTPFIYPVVPNDYLASMGFRFTMVKNYMLFYIVEEKQINVIRFLYGHRDWINILNNTNGIGD